MGLLDRRIGKPVRLAQVGTPWRVLCFHKMATGLSVIKVVFNNMEKISPQIESTDDKIAALRAQIEALEAVRQATPEVPASENQEVATAPDPMQAERQSAADAADLVAVQERLGIPTAPNSATDFESERKAYQNEAEVRATERNENQTLLEKLKFWDRNTSLGMLQEEANTVNKLVDEERAKNPSMTEQAVAEKVLSSPEFGHKLEKQIAVEEEAAKLGVEVEFLSAIRNHDMKALLAYREKPMGRKEDKEIDVMNDLQKKEIEYAMSSGDPEVISMVADKFSFTIDAFAKIPEQVRGDERIQKAYLKCIEWNFNTDQVRGSFDSQLNFVKIAKGKLERLKKLGLTDKTISTEGLREKANEQLMSILDQYVLNPKGVADLLDRYADTGLTKNADALSRDPVIHNKIKEGLKRRVEWQTDRGLNRSTTSLKDVRGYIQRGFISREEAKADPVLAGYA